MQFTMRSVKGKLLILGAAVGLATLVVVAKMIADAQSFQGRFGNYVSWDSGLYPGSPPLWPQWLDEDTVVFMGNMSAKPRDFVASRHLQSAMIIWRLGQPPAEHTEASALAGRESPGRAMGIDVSHRQSYAASVTRKRPWRGLRGAGLTIISTSRPSALSQLASRSMVTLSIRPRNTLESVG
jgi:hypothetical protein